MQSIHYHSPTTYCFLPYDVPRICPECALQPLCPVAVCPLRPLALNSTTVSPISPTTLFLALRPTTCLPYMSYRPTTCLPYMSFRPTCLPYCPKFYVFRY